MGARVSLSVIVPVYNTGKYLVRCLDTLVAQTTSEMEIIVVDDHSDEDIRSVASAYIGRVDRPLRFERLERHKGPGGARNRGLALASGDFVAFCDSDDWVDITYFQTCVEAMERQGASVGMCSLARVYDYTQSDTLYKCKYDQEIQMTGEFALKLLTRQLDAGIQVIPSTVNKVYRREYLDQINLRFVEDKLFEDLLFSFVCIMNAPKIVCVPGVVYHHYKRPDSIVQSFDRRHIDDFAAVFALLREQLQNTGRDNEYRFHYYKFFEQFYNLIVREIFEFVPDEAQRKEYLAYSFRKVIPLINFEEYMEYTTAEQLRRHIQPHINDTTIY